MGTRSTATTPTEPMRGQLKGRRPEGETSAHTAAKFLAMRERGTRRPPESAEFLGEPSYKRGGQLEYQDRGVVQVEIQEATYAKIRAEAKRRGIRIRSVLELALRSVPWTSDRQIEARTTTSSSPATSTDATRRAPNQRGVGPSYRAADLCRDGMLIEEAAAREGVSVASVRRAIQFRGSRVG